MTQLEQILEDNNGSESKCEEKQSNLQFKLKDFPDFLKLKKEKYFSGPLSRYSNFTLAKFIVEYNNHGLKGKKVYDMLMEKLAPEYLEIKAEEPVRPPLSTVFPNSFDPAVPLGEEYKRMITELLFYFNQTSVVPKNAKRATICDLYFNQHHTPKEIQQTSQFSLPTILDNFLTPLFRKGAVDEISLNPEFKTAVDQCLAAGLYFPAGKLQKQLQLDDDDFSQFLYLFNYAVYENLKDGQSSIIIQKEDSSKVSECLTKLYSTLNDELLPISKKDLYIKLAGIIDQKKILPDYLDTVISTHQSIATNSDGLIYIKDEALKGVISRICRIVYKSPSHTARKDDIIATYKSLYGDEDPAFRQEALKERGIFSISHGGVYQYSKDGTKPITVHEFIDKYIAEKILFRWSELLVKIKEINPALIEDSEKSYTTKSCSSCATDSDILVLKGYEDEYPQYKWKVPRMINKTNITINYAVDLLRKKGDNGMSYREFTKELNKYLVAKSIGTNSTKDVIKKFTEGDTKIFIQKGGNIKLDNKVLAGVSLDHIGLGYKYTDFYLSIYALAVSELKSKAGNKMLRSEIAALANSQISEEIDGKIVNKAFRDNLMPKFLSVEGERGDAYVCLDMSIFKEENKSELQYKVADDSNDSQNEAEPTLVVDTTPRPDVSYRKIFNWPDIISILKKDLKRYDKPYFYQGISSDDVMNKFQKFMSQSTNIYLNALVPQAYYELSYANVDMWSSFDYRSKIARAFESLLMDVYYQNRGVESQTNGLWEIMDLAFPEYLNARKNYDRNGFNGILNNIYNDRNKFAHPTTSELPTLVSNISAFVSYMALYVYTIAKYYKE